MPSPVLSVESIVRPQDSASAGQSPAPTYQPLLGLTPSFIRQPLPSQGCLQDTLDLLAAPLQYQYKQTDEERLREELSRAETLFGINPSETLDILSELGDVLMSQERYKSAGWWKVAKLSMAMMT